MGLQRSRLVRVVVAIALVALAAVGLRLSKGEEGGDYQVVRGRVGQPVAVTDGQVTVRDVRVGTALSRRDEVTAVTAGLFVVVRVEIAATGSVKVPLYDARVLVGDRSYESFGGYGTNQVPPGFATEQDLVFELDPAQLADLTLELRPGEVITAYPRRARIHLGITADNAEAWRAAGRDRVLEPGDPTKRGI